MTSKRHARDASSDSAPRHKRAHRGPRRPFQGPLGWDDTFSEWRMWFSPSQAALGTAVVGRDALVIVRTRHTCTALGAAGARTVAHTPVPSWLGGRLETDGVSRPTADTSRGGPISRRRRTQSRVVPNSRWGQASQVGRLELTWAHLKTDASQVCERTRLKTKATRNGRGHLELDASQDGGRVLRPARLETLLGRSLESSPTQDGGGHLKSVVSS